MAGPLDRPRHQLRKQRNKRRIPDKTRLLLDPAPVEIDGITHRLKHKKRDAHRQQHVRRRYGVRNVHRRQQRIYIIYDERAILEKAQQPQIVQDTQRKKKRLPPPSRHPQHRQIIHQCRIRNQKQIIRVPPPIKRIRRQQQPRCPKPGVPRRPINRKHHRKKNQKHPIMEQHNRQPRLSTRFSSGFKTR